MSLAGEIDRSAVVERASLLDIGCLTYSPTSQVVIGEEDTCASGFFASELTEDARFEKIIRVLKCRRSENSRARPSSRSVRPSGK